MTSDLLQLTGDFLRSHTWTACLVNFVASMFIGFCCHRFLISIFPQPSITTKRRLPPRR